MSDTDQIKQESFDKEQIDRIFSHRQHLVEHFYNRLNTFLVFESILLGIIGILYTKSSPPLLLLRMFASLGLIATLIWWYTQASIRSNCYKVTQYVKNTIPEYKVLLEIEGKRHGTTQDLLTHPLPLLMLFIWIVLLLFA
jgi:hypothetical protein